MEKFSRARGLGFVTMVQIFSSTYINIMDTQTTITILIINIPHMISMVTVTAPININSQTHHLPTTPPPTHPPPVNQKFKGSQTRGSLIKSRNLANNFCYWFLWGYNTIFMKLWLDVVILTSISIGYKFSWPNHSIINHSIRIVEIITSMSISSKYSSGYY